MPQEPRIPSADAPPREVPDDYAALQASEAKYRDLFWRMGEGFCIIEHADVPAGAPIDFLYVEANAAFEAQTGVANIVGRTLRGAFPLEPHGWFETYDEIARTGIPRRFERGLVTQGRVLEVNAFRIEVEPKPRIAVFFSDISRFKRVEYDLRETERRLLELNADLERQVVDRSREAEAVLAETQAALRQSQKMDAVGQLTGGLAHDFNNLIASIDVSLDLLQHRVAQGRTEELNRYVAAAQDASRRAAALTHRLLAFSRQQTLAPSVTDTGRLLEGMAEMLRAALGPSIALRLPPSVDGAWTTCVDQGQLESAVLNLCINARDAMPDGGTLTVSLDARTLETAAARQVDATPGDYVVLKIRDTGAGMTPDVIARAFEPFFTTKPLGMGTGLGLSMVYGFVQQSGGRVSIESVVRRGTSISIYLPRYEGTLAVEAATPARQGSAPAAAPAGSVLVVDDETTMRLLVAEILEDAGFEIAMAADGAGGLAVLQSGRRLDLLVTDVGLPGGMDGRQLVDAARRLRPDLKVLFITGYAESAVLGQLQLGPGMALLTKPFPMEALLARVGELQSDGRTVAAGNDGPDASDPRAA